VRLAKEQSRSPRNTRKQVRKKEKGHLSGGPIKGRVRNEGSAGIHIGANKREKSNTKKKNLENAKSYGMKRLTNKLEKKETRKKNERMPKPADKGGSRMNRGKRVREEDGQGLRGCTANEEKAFLGADKKENNHRSPRSQLGKNADTGPRFDQKKKHGHKKGGGKTASYAGNTTTGDHDNGRRRTSNQLVNQGNGDKKEQKNNRTCNETHTGKPPQETPTHGKRGNNTVKEKRGAKR